MIKRGADGDGGVGDIEGRIVVGAEPDFEEVGDRAAHDAVGDVAGGAAEEQREARGGHAAADCARQRRASRARRSRRRSRR